MPTWSARNTPKQFINLFQVKYHIHNWNMETHMVKTWYSEIILILSQWNLLLSIWKTWQQFTKTLGLFRPNNHQIFQKVQISKSIVNYTTLFPWGITCTLYKRYIFAGIIFSKIKTCNASRYFATAVKAGIFYAKWEFFSQTISNKSLINPITIVSTYTSLSFDENGKGTDMWQILYSFK